jgi:regulatory protein
MKEKDLIITPAKIRFAAMDLLTGREFSRSELAKKLDKRFDKDSAIKGVLDQLQEEGLQCDQRFAEAFVRSRLYRGHGMARIRLDIRQKGINDDLFESAIEKAEINWFELARDVAKRKFGSRAAADQKEKAKRMRFLQYRGFNFDQIKYALQEKDCDEYTD